MTEVHIAELRTDQPIRIDGAPNGGWIVSQESMHMGERGRVLGAYSNARDMLQALMYALDPEMPECAAAVTAQAVEIEAVSASPGITQRVEQLDDGRIRIIAEEVAMEVLEDRK